MMFDEIIYIVGDKFGRLSDIASIKTVTQLKQAVVQKKIHSETVLVFSQGLNEAEKSEISCLIRKSTANIIINAYQKPARSEHTHKKDIKNILVSDPVVLSAGKKFRSQLLIDDDCAEMSDHVTGVHIQGMLLIEAARQLAIAVSEKFLLETKDCYFLLKSMSTLFNKFIFPMDVIIEQEIVEIKILRAGFKDIAIRTVFIQNGEVASSVDMELRINAKTLLEKIEYQMASEMIMKNTLIVAEDVYFDRVG